MQKKKGCSFLYRSNGGSCGGESTSSLAAFETVRNPVRVMMAEHDAADTFWEKL
jgi:hypothetical protein